MTTATNFIPNSNRDLSAGVSLPQKPSRLQSLFSRHPELSRKKSLPNGPELFEGTGKSSDLGFSPVEKMPSRQTFGQLPLPNPSDAQPRSALPLHPSTNTKVAKQPPHSPPDSHQKESSLPDPSSPSTPEKNEPSSEDHSSLSSHLVGNTGSSDKSAEPSNLRRGSKPHKAAKSESQSCASPSRPSAPLPTSSSSSTAPETGGIALPPSAFNEGGLHEVMMQFPACGRNFSAERFERHSVICAQATENARNRGVFNSHKQRRLPVGAAAPGPSAQSPSDVISKTARPAEGDSSNDPSDANDNGQSSVVANKKIRPKKAKPLAKPSTVTSPSAVVVKSEQDKEKVWLQQRSAEITFTLRFPLTTAADVDRARTSIQTLHVFLTRLDEIATALTLPPETVFQELLSRLAAKQTHGSQSTNANSPSDFDRQHGSGAVPMHQAKVLNRKARLTDAKVTEALEKKVGLDELHEMVGHVDALRSVVKIKVEDANDLKMARACLEDAFNFFRVLHEFANRNDLTLYDAYLQTVG